MNLSPIGRIKTGVARTMVTRGTEEEFGKPQPNMLTLGYCETITIMVINTINVMSLKRAEALFPRPRLHYEGQLLLYTVGGINAGPSIDLEKMG